jgi:ribose transport system substrate-binding protein
MSSEATEVRHAARSHLPAILIAVVALVIAGAVYFTQAVDRTPTLKLALITNHQGPFWDPVIRGAQDAAPESKVELTVIKSEPDAEAQSKHVRDLLGRGIDGIAISPINPQAQAAVLDEAAGKTALITFDSDAPDSKRRLFVGTDDYAAGQAAGQEVRDAIPDGGAVVISARSIEMINGRNRRQGLIDDLLDRSFKYDRPADPLDATLKGSKYSVAATVLDDGNRDKAVSGLTEAIKKHPDVKCIVGLFTNSGHYAVEAIEKAGKTGQIKVVGFDESDETQRHIEAGQIHSSILQDQYRCGFEAVRLLADSARGVDQKGPLGARRTHLPIHVLRQNNLEDMRGSGRVRTPGVTGRPAGAPKPPATTSATVE